MRIKPINLNKSERKRSIKDKLTDIFRRKLPSIYYWIHNKRHKYTTVKPRHLKDQFVDRDYLLLCTIYEVAQVFMETEGPKTREDWRFLQKYSKFEYDALREVASHIKWWDNYKDLEYPFNKADYSGKETVWPKSIKRLIKYKSKKYNKRYSFIHLEEEKSKEMRDRAKRIVDLSIYFWT